MKVSMIAFLGLIASAAAFVPHKPVRALSRTNTRSQVMSFFNCLLLNQLRGDKFLYCEYLNLHFLHPDGETNDGNGDVVGGYC